MENAEVKKLLVVIDYQNDFVSGVLGSESAKRIEDSIMKLLTEFSPTGYSKRVAFTQDSHAECSYMSTREGKHLPVPRSASVKLKNSTVERTFKDPEIRFSYPMKPRDLLSILDKINHNVPNRIPYV